MNVLIIVPPYRTVASLTDSGGQEFRCPHSLLKFDNFFLFFLFFFIFFLILAPGVGDSPTRKGPGYATAFIYFISYLLMMVINFWVTYMPIYYNFFNSYLLPITTFFVMLAWLFCRLFLVYFNIACLSFNYYLQNRWYAYIQHQVSTENSAIYSPI